MTRLAAWLGVGGPPSGADQRLTLLALHAGGGAILALFTLTAPLHGGLGPYLEELGAAATSLPRLAFYTAVVVAYALAVELLLRGLVQPWLARRWGARAGILGAAALYGLLHLHHGPVGALYALLLGAWVGALRARGAPLWVFPVWHLQWDLTAILATLAAALAAPGAPRAAVDFAYKATLVEQGRLQRDPDLGWLDAAHYYGAQRRACAVWAALDRGEQEVTLRAEQQEASGARRTLTTRFSLTSPPAPDQRLPLAAALTWRAALEEEQAQAAAPLWTALPLSAWSFEDLPSVQAGLEALLDHPEQAPERCAQIATGDLRARPIPKALQGAAATLRWDAEGRGLVTGHAAAWSPPDAPRGAALEALARRFAR